MTKAKGMDLANVLRHAFLAGRRCTEKLTSEDTAAWVAYDPTTLPAYQRIADMIEQQDEPAIPNVGVPEAGLIIEITAELMRARAKFPGPDCTFAALSEEVGEVAKALMEEPRANVRKEAVQVAVMAMRIILDGDCTFDEWRKNKGLDPLLVP